MGQAHEISARTMIAPLRVKSGTLRVNPRTRPAAVPAFCSEFSTCNMRRFDSNKGTNPEHNGSVAYAVFSILAQIPYNRDTRRCQFSGRRPPMFRNFNKVQRMALIIAVRQQSGRCVECDKVYRCTAIKRISMSSKDAKRQVGMNRTILRAKSAH